MTELAPPALDVRDITVVYQRGGSPAVEDFSLSLTAGETVLLTGERGAGKTSLIRAALGLIPLLAGSIQIFGAGTSADAMTRRAIGYGPQGRTFCGDRSIRSMVATTAFLRTGLRTSAPVDAALARVGLETSVADGPIRDVEVGRRASLACAIVGEPRLLLLDDPWEFEETLRVIAEARESGGSVLVATHDSGSWPDHLDRVVELETAATP